MASAYWAVWNGDGLADAAASLATDPDADGEASADVPLGVKVGAPTEAVDAVLAPHAATTSDIETSNVAITWRFKWVPRF